MIVRLCFVLCLAVHLGTTDTVTVKNNAYHGLVISFAPEINSKDGKTLIDNLKGLLERTSDALHTAIGVRIADVAFHLPSAWDTSRWEDVTVHPASTPLVGKEDILVEHVPDSAFGERPLALQYGGCTVPGHKILLQTTFLSNDNEGYPKEKLLAREWLKYRYGVFDENGFNGDEMYPSFYQIPGTTGVEITECTDPEVQFDLKNSSGDGYCTLEIPFVTVDCHVHPRESFHNVTSSLMYFHQELTAMDSVCGKNHTHKNFTPSKHNLLCNGKSIWDVLKLSSDFKNEEGTVEPPQDEEKQGIEFSYLKEFKPRVVIAFENSIKLHYQGDMILFAIRRLIDDLPDGSDFGLYNYDDNTEQIRQISALTPDNRALPIPVMFMNDDKKICISCAVSEAVKALADQPKIQGSIIVVGDSTSFDGEENLVTKMKELQLNTRNLCLTLVAFANTSQQNQPTVFKDLESLSNCISVLVLHKEEAVTGSTFDELYQVLHHTVPHSPTTSQTSTVVSGIMSSDISLDIPMDVTSDKYTLWLPKLLQSNSIQCKTGDNSITLTPGVQRLDIASYSFPAAEENVNCKLRSPALPIVATPYFTHVERTTKPGEYFEEEVWIHDTTESNGEQMPVIIFARINFGNYPVQNAKVVANITGPKGDLLELDLFDNGKGDPDITQNDGIYSRYFVGLTEEGEYQVTVTAENGNSTKVGKDGTDGCCGSKVKSESVELQHPFRRSKTTSFRTKGTKPELGYKPSRILDLRVNNYNPMAAITLKWTAPGGEADNGKASSYEFHFFCKSEDCKGNGQLPSWIKFNESMLTPGMSGQEELVELMLSDAPNNETLSIGLKSRNQNDKLSEISNIVMVELDSSFEPPTTEDPDKIRDRKGARMAIRAIVGSCVLGLLVLICIALAVYFFADKVRSCKARNFKDIPKAKHINCEFPEQIRASNLATRDSSMRRVESFPVLLYTHDQIKDFKNKKGKPTPLFKENERPKPWMSLGSLPSNSNKEKYGGSDGSASTMPAIDSDSHSTEMKEVDDNNSHDSDFYVEKVARF